MIIGVIGFKRSGKDTFADYFVGLCSFKKYSFAKPLKDGVMAFFGWTEPQMNDPVLKEEIDEFWGISPRQALQWVGTDAMRKALPEAYPLFKQVTDNNIWVKRFERTVSINPGVDFVIPDVRFQNEVDAIRKQGGLIIRLHRQSAVPEFIEHASEDVGLLTGIDLHVNNEGSILALHREAGEIYKRFKQ